MIGNDCWESSLRRVITEADRTRRISSHVATHSLIGILSLTSKRVVRSPYLGYSPSYLILVRMYDVWSGHDRLTI